MTWAIAVRWALYWADQDGYRRRVYGYRSGGRWAYAVTSTSPGERV